MAKSATRPSYKVYAVTKAGDRSYWQEIGALWPRGDEQEFHMRLDLLPLNGADIVVRKPKPAEGEGAQ